MAEMEAAASYSLPLRADVRVPTRAQRSSSGVVIKLPFVNRGTLDLRVKLQSDAPRVSH